MFENLHPILVHFPIALLTVYAGLEVFRLPALTRQVFYTPMKGFLLTIGTLGAFAARQAGEIDAEGVSRTSSTFNILRVHDSLSGFATAVFAVLTAAYLLQWLAHVKPELAAKSGLKQLVHLATWITKPWLVIPLAVAGLVLLTATASLGGAMVYGPNADPIVTFFYNLLVTGN